MNQALLDREKGQLPVSIATSLAIESAFGIYPEKEVPVPPIKDIDAIWISMRTLFRNLMGSIASADQESQRYDEVADQLIDEMTVIEAAVNQFTSGKTRVVFYNCSYMSASRRYRHALHWIPNTPKQKAAWELEQKTLQTVTQLAPGSDLRHYDFDFDPHNDDRVFLISHYPVDLFNRYKFKTLLLLESHTGAIKPPAFWHTKLKSLDRNFEHMPFDRMTLQVFGDGVMFVQVPIKVRSALVAIAVKYEWSTVTTKDYVLSCVNKEHDPVLEGWIHKLYS